MEPTYKDLGDGNFEETVPSTTQYNPAALAKQIVQHTTAINDFIATRQAAIEVITTKLQRAADAKIPDVQPALDAILAQPKHEAVDVDQALEDIAATVADPV